jgi:hypothetical protein
MVDDEIQYYIDMNKDLKKRGEPLISDNKIKALVVLNVNRTYKRMAYDENGDKNRMINNLERQ